MPRNKGPFIERTSFIIKLALQYRADLVEMLDILRLGIYSSMQGFWRHLSRLGIALSNVVQGAAMWFWYRTGRWKTKKIIKNGSENSTRKVV